jgi:hypothetical protein
MKSSVWVTALILTVASGLFVANIGVHAETPLNGIITSNTTWTKANSPYVLRGHVIISPILTAPASGAPAIADNVPSHTPQPTVNPTSNQTETQTAPPAHATQTPTATHRPADPGILSELNMVEVAILAVLIVIVFLLASLIMTLRRKR